MKLFDKCPVCGGELITKTVEKLLRGGNHTAVVKVKADVCLKCGERLYSPQVVRKFEQIRERLIKNNLAKYKVTGKTVRV